MLFCQVGRAHSLREICGGLASVEGKLNHLGIGNAPARSTLSYANAHRPYALFEEVFGQLLERCRSLAAPKPFRFKNKLYSLDATVIDLCLSAFDWAKFRRTKGAIKLHLLLDHDGCLPCYGVITEGKTQEIRVARTLEWPPGSIVVMDRGYVDYGFLDSLEDRRVFFVTRLKENAAFSVEAEISASKGNIRADQMISLPGSGKNAKALRLFRRVVVWDEARARNRALDQQSETGRQHHCRHLQGALANRTLFQVHQAEPQDQDLRGHQPQRCTHSDLDSTYGHPASEVSANAQPARLESFQPSGSAAPQSLCAS